MIERRRAVHAAGDVQGPRLIAGGDHERGQQAGAWRRGVQRFLYENLSDAQTQTGRVPFQAIILHFVIGRLPGGKSHKSKRRRSWHAFVRSRAKGPMVGNKVSR